MMDRLTEIATELEAVRPDLARWLTHCLARWRAGEPLDAALGLGRSDRRQAARFWLRHAADLIREPGRSDRSVAVEVAARLAALRRVRCPDECDMALQRAVSSGGRVPRSWRRLYDVIAM